MSNNLVIYGAGGHGRVVADTAIASGWSVLGFMDNGVKKGTEIYRGLKVIFSDVSDFVGSIYRDCYVITAVGNNFTRKILNSRLFVVGINVPSIIHPKAIIAPSVSIGRGSVVFAGVVVNSASVLGEGVIINTASSIDHDNLIGDYAHISPGTHTGGHVCVGSGTHVGLGSSIKDTVIIGNWSIIGAGSVVVNNIGSNVVVYGNPAKFIRPLKEDSGD